MKTFGRGAWTVCSLALLAGCGARGGLDELTGEEREAWERGTSSHLSLQQALDLSDSMFNFDPTLDASKTAAENAALVQTQVKSELGTCGTVTLNQASVTVAFGQAPGCTLSNGKTVTGSITVALTKSGATLSAAVTFASLTVDDKDLTGTATFTTTNATTFTVVLALSSGLNTVNANVTVVGAPGSITLDGTASATRNATTTTLAFTSVLWGRAECYPKSGSVKVTKGAINQTYTFNSSTPTTGTVDLALGRKTVQVQLPAYGKCPPGKDGGA